MVDNVNPNTQFHPYQPQDAIPQTGISRPTGFRGMLNRVGIDQSKINAMGAPFSGLHVSGGWNKVRGAAQKNPSLLLGGLAALAIGAGLMRRRSMTRSSF